MENNFTKFKDELEKLLKKGKLLLYSMIVDLKIADDATEKKLRKLDLPSFKNEYEQWYTISLQVIKQVIPDRLNDFKALYKYEKRKQTDHLTYGVSDYMIGLQTSRGSEVLTDGKAAYPKFDQQLNILKSAATRLNSALYDMTEMLQADLFDDELDSARELNKKGFIRGAGAVAGVVLEKHLNHICLKNNLKSRKKHPGINDFNQLLKDNEIIETALWRNIQHLGDIRNLCDHHKSREPKKEEVDELISGVSKVIKTLF